MPLRTADELHERLQKLAKDVDTLGTVAALGFYEKDDGRIGASVRQVEQDSAWKFIDYRYVEDADLKQSLAKTLRAPTAVILFHALKPPTSVLEAIRAAVDEKSDYIVGGHSIKRPENQSLLLLAQGATELNAVPEALKRIEIWDFIS